MKPTPTLIAVTCLVLLMGCEPRSPSLPDNLIGVWRTSDPKYAGRFLQLTQDRVIFGTGAGSVSIHPIRKIARAPRADGILYAIIYTNDDGQEYRLSFVHDLEHGGVIWFKNQKDILWKRANR
jgi:hypothetical protein